jgi:CRISPR/Cas system-associated endonuclease Cas1
MTALRPLYLDCGAAALRLEGPALIVDQPDSAEGRFPLRLLSRVVVRGPVPWSMEALFACLASGVPITFLSLDGAVIGSASAATARRSRWRCCSTACSPSRVGPRFTRAGPKRRSGGRSSR